MKAYFASFHAASDSGEGRGGGSLLFYFNFLGAHKIRRFPPNVMLNSAERVAW